ncbi:DUF3995 domain-containing protein [Roseibium aggregatum]|uniref:DUF3995 domain-containing protein n=1 Tax=Roseibium aggregatum TaxID=187304 RepID=A0A926NY29_9HYPH|nr:DUF3995 domain-containing protein [Roseibium aggregatum]MBD1546436.1 DUF3995 domain-containing protein [Roseibium aggregatum]
MTVLAAALSFGLLVIAVIHALWGVKVWWPIADETALARTVVGQTGIEKMPPGLSCFLVAGALCIGALALWAALNFFPLPEPAGVFGRYLVAAFAAVFLLRGLAGYSGPFSRRFSEEPFRSFDRRFYSPLCLVFGAGFTAVFLGVSQ